MVINGGFNNNCAGWTLDQTDGFPCSSIEGNPDYALILNNSPGPVPQASQTIAGLQIGQLYQITIDAKSHYNCCDFGSPGAGVGIDGQQFDFVILNSQPWTTYTFDFTYSGTNNLLVISAQRNGSDADGEFDNVDIIPLGEGSAVPEPATLGILGAALAGLGLIRRRR